MVLQRWRPEIARWTAVRRLIGYTMTRQCSGVGMISNPVTLSQYFGSVLTVRCLTQN